MPLLFLVFLFVFPACFDKKELSGDAGTYPVQKSLSFLIKSKITDSEIFTSDEIVKIEISDDPTVVKWCISELQTERPLPDGECKGGLGSKNGWHQEIPSEISLLSGAGYLRTVYLWVVNQSNQVNLEPIYRQIKLDFERPSIRLTQFPSTYSNKPIFIFDGVDTQGLLKVQCQIDSGGFFDCLSPLILSGLSNAFHTVDFRAIDQAGNISQVESVSFNFDSIKPVLQISSSSEVISSQNTVSFSGQCQADNALDILVRGDQDYEIDCQSNGTFSFISGPITSDGEYSFIFSQMDLAGNVSEKIGVFLRDTKAPVLIDGSMKINDGIGSTMHSVVSLAFEAVDENTPIVEFCLKWQDTSQPGSGDSCWQQVSSVLPASNVPTRIFELNNYFFQIGFASMEYSVFAWVKDQAGNISSLTNSGSGTLGLDKDTILLSIPPPPQVNQILVANTNVPSSPPTSAEQSIPFGGHVYIKWFAADSNGLAADPISLYYTTDDVNYHLIASGLNNGSNGGCAINEVATTADDQATGCFVWVSGSPANGFFRIQARARNNYGLEASSASSPINVAEIRILAGNVDPGTNSSAAAAMFFNEMGNYMNADPQSFVVTDAGIIYFRDKNRGILKIDPADGVQRVFIPTTGVSSGDDGPAASATLRLPLKIALDFSQNLLILDYNRIRRVNLGLNSNPIKTLIGGGASAADGVGPLDVLINPATTLVSTMNTQFPMIPLPNGDLVFMDNQYGETPNAAGWGIRRYVASTNKVQSIVPSGVGDSYQANVDIRRCVVLNYKLGFNTISALIDKFFVATIHHNSNVNCSAPVGDIWGAWSNLDPISFAASSPHPPENRTKESDVELFVQAMNGEIFSITRQFARITKYNKTNNTWVNLVGTGDRGSCADGTLALSCKIDPQAAFVNKNGTLYFMDRGLLRTINEEGKILTLMGQAFDFGDGSNVLSARFSDISGAFKWNDSGLEKIVVLDRDTAKFREFPIGGSVATIAGNGQDASSTITTLANQHYIKITGAGLFFDMFQVSASGKIYYHRYTGGILELNRGTGYWQNFMGGGGTNYYAPTADGMTGENLKLTGYAPQAMGIYGNDLLVSFYSWDGSKVVYPHIKLYNTSTKIQRHLVGGGISGTGFCADGTAVSSCNIFQVAATYYTYSQFEPNLSAWLVARRESNSVQVYTEGGVKQTLVSLARNKNAFYYRRNADLSVNILYYCGIDGRLYKYDFNSVAKDVALFWPMNSMICSGNSLVYDANRNSLIFPFKQNGLSGVAEYVNP